MYFVLVIIMGVTWTVQRGGGERISFQYFLYLRVYFGYWIEEGQIKIKNVL